MICGHGSRDPQACLEFEALVHEIGHRLEGTPVEHGYLEFARPILRDGLDRLRERGAGRILAVPGMLFAAGHVKNDVPSVLNAWAAQSGLPVAMGRDLGIDPKLLEAARDRIAAALRQGGMTAPTGETLLLVIGRGTSDSDANGNVAKVARMLWEGMGFAHAEVGYSGVAHPRTDEALRRAARLGYRRIVVFPYFLFTGVLVRRIYDAVDRFGAEHPELEVLKAGYLNDHPRVVDTFVERLVGIEGGDTAMNCGLCKYRVQIIGYEQDLGAAQESHHHHVEGIGTDPDQHHRPRRHHHDHHHHHRGGHGHRHESEPSAAE
jgi:sirohydrochlorin cobaltochelatase